MLQTELRIYVYFYLVHLFSLNHDSKSSFLNTTFSYIQHGRPSSFVSKFVYNKSALRYRQPITFALPNPSR